MPFTVVYLTVHFRLFNWFSPYKRFQMQSDTPNVMYFVCIIIGIVLGVVFLYKILKRKCLQIISHHISQKYWKTVRYDTEPGHSPRLIRCRSIVNAKSAVRKLHTSCKTVTNRNNNTHSKLNNINVAHTVHIKRV